MLINDVRLFVSHINACSHKYYCCVMILHRRGLLHCSFSKMGNAKASENGTSKSTDSRAFLCHFGGCGHRHIERGGCLLAVSLIGQMAIPQTLQIQHLPVAICRPHGKRHGHADFVLRYTLYVFQKNITTFLTL